MKRLLILVVTLLSLAGCQKKDSRPNIIVFYSDELDPAYLSCYGDAFQTPHLDKLAQEGIRFTNAFTVSPMCTPSRFSLLTGTYPGRCRHEDFLEAYPEDKPYVIAWNTYLEGSLPTIASVLSENGYLTGMAGKWHIGKLPEDVAVPEFTEDEDLDDPSTEKKLQSYQQMISEQVKKDAGFDVANSVLWANYDNFPIKSLQTHNFPWITSGAIDFLEEAGTSGKPFFLYVATTAVHGPGHGDAFNKDLSYTLEGRRKDILRYQLPADSMLKVLEGMPGHLQHKYAGMACLDHHVSQVIAKVKALELEDETVIFFMADHNVEPGKATCYDKGLRVPLIIKIPGSIKNIPGSSDKTAGTPEKIPGTTDNGSVNDMLVSNVDIFPTILQLSSTPIPEGVQLDGISMLPGIRSEQIRTRPYIYAESGLTRSVSDGRWKYIAFRYPESQIEKMKSGAINYAPNFLNMERQAHSSIAMEHFPGYFDADQLYDLQHDPYEQNNLAYNPEFNDQLKRLQGILSDHLSTFDHAFDLSDTSFMRSPEYEELARQSKSLGTDYIPWLRRDHGRIVWPPEE